MRIKIPLFFLFAMGLFPITGVTQDTLKNNIYQVWVRSAQNHRTSLGYLQNLSDSTMTIGKLSQSSTVDSRIIPVSQVKWVKFRERRSIMRGIGRGALLGFSIGFFIGILKGDTSPCEDKYCVRVSPIQNGLIYSIYTTPFGALAGAFVGSFKTKINIGGSRSQYSRQREELEKFRIRQ